MSHIVCIAVITVLQRICIKIKLKYMFIVIAIGFVTLPNFNTRIKLYIPVLIRQCSTWKTKNKRRKTVQRFGAYHQYHIAQTDWVWPRNQFIIGSPEVSGQCRHVWMFASEAQCFYFHPARFLPPSNLQWMLRQLQRKDWRTWWDWGSSASKSCSRTTSITPR